MDPRHPEFAIARMDELMRQYKHILETMRTEMVSNKVGEEEREGSLVVQEICLVAPRLHESMMQVSRTRRAAISHGLVEKPVEKSESKPSMMDETTAPKKKTARKKKTTKKKEDK